MKKKVVALFAGILTMTSVAILMASFTLSWFTGRADRAEDEILPGEVGLRGYFFTGNGSSSNPYEIVLPIHFYNLSRLQNYGVFGKDTFFQIGHDFDPDDGVDNYQCIDSDSGEKVDYLDMAPFFRDNPNIEIRPVGSESTPFRGTFWGHGIPIQNLKIAGYPEDIGVFGYASSDASIDGLICSNLEVKSLGYTKTESDPRHILYGADIENIFNEHASELAYQTNLDFYSYNSSTGTYDRANSSLANPGLKNALSGGVKYEHIDANLVEGTNLYNGYFVITKPTIANDPFKYGWSASTSLITESKVLNINPIPDNDENPDNLIMIDLDLFANAGENPGEFNNDMEELQIDTRLSIIAYKEIEGIVYSRVIQSYVIEFYSNASHFGEGKEYMKIFCTYTTPEEPTHESSNYYHGNNIGFLVGHLDGTLSNSYVYKGTLKFNSNDYDSIKTETQTGLVGEVGTNVINALNPDYNITTDGEIGVMNFTRIYNGIRSDFASKPSKSSESGNYYYNYTSKINADGSDSILNLYRPYLRTNAAANGTQGDQYITGTLQNPGTYDHNAVDFLPNKIIQDEDMDTENPKNRGLGVFKLITPRNEGMDEVDTSPNKYGDHVFDNLKECRIINGAPKDKVYFSTAEYNHSIDGPAWGVESTQIDPLRATTLPSYKDESSFNYPFSRDYNYVFELDLTQNSAEATHNYMYNTNSQFLSNYLSHILKDKYGAPISHGNYRFGFMLRSSENIPLTSLSSYMPISNPKTPLQSFGGKTYPSNSIVFNIENDSPGANVSVVGNKQNISIYKFRTDGSANNTITKLFTMKSENVSDVDSHRFFTYDYRDGQGGATSTTATRYEANSMGDGNCLYAHIFYLPKLPENEAYCIGASDEFENNEANLYYLAVQGQTAGTIDTGKMADVGNSLTNVDFLVKEPTKGDFAGGGAGYASKKAQNNFSARFNTALGEFNVDTIGFDTNGDEIEDTFYLKYVYYNNPQFITYLMGYDFKRDPDTPEYYVDNDGNLSTPAVKHDSPSELLINITT